MAALARDDVRVIPVLVEGATMPSAAELPEALRPLAQRNAVSLSDAGWHWDTARLADAIGGGSAPGKAGWLWMLPAFVAHGGLALLYAGLRARKPSWVWLGALYCLPLLALWAWEPAASDTALVTYGLSVSFFLAALASLVHVLLIRKRFRGLVGDPMRLSATPWLLPSFVGLGGAALVYAGARTKSSQWLGYGLLYCVPTVILACGVTVPFSGHWWLWFLAATAALVHVFAIRSAVPAIVKGMRAGEQPQGQVSTVLESRRDPRTGRLELFDRPRLDDRL